MKTSIPQFKTKKELYKFLVDNKETLIAEKKAERKFSDCISYSLLVYDAKSDSYKANAPVNVADLNELKVKVIINTTNILDSHLDVHLKNLWNKSIKENKNIKFVQEHEMRFTHIIADKKDLKVYVQDFTWKELGFPKFEGTTQALVFEAVVKRERNPEMFKQYSGGHVDQHSVGMFYVELYLCINDADDDYWEEEYKNWNKYIDQVVNKELAEEVGYFWAVKQAKVIEGSAVVLGSNYATPTLENNMKGAGGTHSPTVDSTEPEQSTRDSKYQYLIENFSLT